MTELLQNLASGVMIGIVYALLSIGFSLSWGTLGVISIVHPAFAVLGAYIAYFSYHSFGFDPIASLLFTIPVFFFIGVAINSTLFNRLNTITKHVGFASMVVTFGMAITLENLMKFFFTADPRLLRIDYLRDLTLSLGGVSIASRYLVAAFIALITLAVIYYFLYSTYTGKAVRAVEQEKEGAAFVGINVMRVSSITYGIALASAGVAGLALAMVYPFEPPIHIPWLVIIFLVVIAGGVGSVVGTILTGLIVGLLFTLSGMVVPFSLVNLVIFLALIVVLIFRPKGIWSV